jgi:hypothetical protein
MRALAACLIFLLLISSCSESPESVEKKLQKLEQQMEALEKERNEKYLEFAIHGKVTDKDSGRVTLFGDSYPAGISGWDHVGSARNGAIIVQNPDPKALMIDYYTAPRGHYFVKKTTGKNIFGAEVPVRVFTTTPPTGKNDLEKKIEKINQEITAIREKQAEKWLKEFSDSLKSEAKEYTNESDALASLRALNDSMQKMSSYNGITIGSKVRISSDNYSMKGRIGDLDVYVINDEGVIILSEKDSIAAITYLSQADKTAGYYSFVKKAKPSSHPAEMPSDAPIAYKLSYLARLGWGSSTRCNTYYPELCEVNFKPAENNPDENQYTVTYRTDGNLSDIIAVTVYNPKKMRFATKYLPLSVSWADTDPVMKESPRGSARQPQVLEIVDIQNKKPQRIEVGQPALAQAAGQHTEAISKEPSPYNEELLSVKYAMTVEDGIVYCNVDSAWGSLTEKDKKDFIRQLGQRRYFGKRQFIVKDRSGARLAEYNKGSIRIH